MSTQSLQLSKDLKAAGSRLGRAELAQRALAIAKAIVEDGSYKRAIEGIGEMKALGQACSFDDYWSEKRDIGFYRQAHTLKQAQPKYATPKEPRP